MSFWNQLFNSKQAIIGMSPMDGVTDAPFRFMVLKYGRPDVIFTEFVSVDGLHYAEDSKRERILKDFIRARDIFDLSLERFCSPYSYLATQMRRSGLKINSPDNSDSRLSQFPFEVAQVFGNKPELFVEAAKLVESLGFDGIDINMGCPAKNVSDNGCGAALIRTPKIAQEIILATKAATKLPVSVKTRIGVSSVNEMEEWIEALCEVAPANISLHGRTLKQMYQGSADWEAISRAAKIAHKHKIHLLGNGDIQSVKDLKNKVKEYGVDGGLIGRAAEGNPGIFTGVTEVAQEQKLMWAREHAQIYENVFKDPHTPVGDNRWFMPMRKHLAWYAHGFAGAVELRMLLMRTKDASEVSELLIKEIS